jgi:hypothetical protein
VDRFYRLTIAAYNLVRLRGLIPIEAMAAWGRSVSAGRKAASRAKQQNSSSKRGLKPRKLHPKEKQVWKQQFFRSR